MTQGCSCCKALWIEFLLCEDLSCTTEKVCARVRDYWQGEAVEPPESDCGDTCDTAEVGDEEMPSVEVYNLKDSAGTKYLFSGTEGDVGLATYDDVEDKYRIVSMGQQASSAIATLSAAMCCDSGTGSITGFTALDGCVSTTPNSGDNTFSLAGKQNQKVFLRRAQETGTWHIVQVQHEEATVIVDHVDDGQCVEVQYQAAALMVCDDPEPEDLICGIDCYPSSGSSAS